MVIIEGVEILLARTTAVVDLLPHPTPKTHKLRENKATHKCLLVGFFQPPPPPPAQRKKHKLNSQSHI